VNGTKKLAAAALVIAAIVSIVVFVRSGITIAEAITWARQMRHVWWAPLAYFALYALLNVLFVPTQLLSVASAVIWGWALGGTIELFAATNGALVPFSIARRLRAPRIADRLKPVLTLTPMQLVLVLRLVPVVPYTALNYAAALSSVTPIQYTVATFLGIIPSTYIFAFFVDAIARGAMEPRDVFLRILLAGGLLALLVIAKRLAAARLPQPEDGTPRRTTRTPDGADRPAE
jgi:uncharacterized membrane protein YdjX (TVP38/TMEM64 family)